MNPAHLAHLATLRARLAAAMTAPTRATDYALAPDHYEPGMPEHLVPVAMPTTGTHCMTGELCGAGHDLRDEHLVVGPVAENAPWAASPASAASAWPNFGGITR